MGMIKRFLKSYWKAYVDFYAPLLKYGVPII